MGLSYIDFNDLDKAINCLNKSINFYKNNYAELIEIYKTIGYIYDLKNDIYNSIQYYENSLKLAEELYNHDSLSVKEINKILLDLYQLVDN